MMGQLTTLDLVELYMFNLVGVRYKWGGKNPLEGLDCSGVVSEVLKSVGVLPHNAGLNSDGLRDFLVKKYPSRVTKDPAQVVRGAIAFFGKPDDVEHVTYCLGLGLMLGAEGGGPSVKTPEDAARAAAFFKMRPLAYRKGFLCAVRPVYPGEA